MLGKLRQQHRRLAIDLDAIGDTLRYIESETAGSPLHTRLHGAIAKAIGEVERLQADDDRPAANDVATQGASAHFIPLLD